MTSMTESPQEPLLKTDVLGCLKNGNRALHLISLGRRLLRQVVRRRFARHKMPQSGE